MYYTDCYHHPLQHHSTTTSGAAQCTHTHSSYLSTTPDCQILTFSLECSTETVIRIYYYRIVCFIFISRRKWPVLFYDTKCLLLPNCIPCFMRFMLYTVCKTLRLSVFNKELFDWLIDWLIRPMSPACRSLSFSGQVLEATTIWPDFTRSATRKTCISRYHPD